MDDGLDVEAVDQRVAKPVHVFRLWCAVVLGQILFVGERHEVDWNMDAVGHSRGDRIAEDVLRVVRKL